jgi:predicted MPP superfamily phosphohydrolase
MELLYWLLATAFSVGLLLALWGIFIERLRFTVRHDELAVLPQGAKPIRVLHISDFHIAPWQKKKLAWIRGLAALKPDLIVNTGDNLGHMDAIRPALEAMKPLMEVPGVFVGGSNDYHAPEIRNPLSYLNKPSTPGRRKLLETATMFDAFEASGWLNLNNRSGSLTVQGTRIGFLGLDDPHDELARYESLNSQVETLTNDDVLFGVAHAPYLRVISEFQSRGSQLVFAGHTHGGQVCLPGGRAIITNCDLPARFAKGLHNIETGNANVWLNVCAGLGTSIFAPIRVFCAPEVRLLTLTAAY